MRASADLYGSVRVRVSGVSDGNRDSRQHPGAAIDSQALSDISPELGIRYT
jgi:hypothetical protein